MPNRFTRGKGLFGKLTFGPFAGSPGKAAALMVMANTVARTDTAAKNLFQLPANAVIDEITIFSPAASDAGTTATLSVGKTGTNTFYVNARDVKTAGTGSGQQVPAGALNMGAIGGSAIQVVGIYAETGGASTTGGPWTVIFKFHLPA